MNKPMHVSGIGSFDDCPRKWFFSNPDWGLGYKPLVVQWKFWFGILIHRALELHYDTGAPLIESAFVQAANEALAELVDDTERERAKSELITARGMLEGYLRWQDHDDSEWSDRSLEHLKAEHEFEFEWKGIEVRGRWDGLARRRDTGQLFIFETKTGDNVEHVLAGLPWDLQPQVYVWAARETLGETVYGVIYNILAKSNPTDVPLLKDGTPSRSKATLAKTTYECYLAAIEKSGADPDNYEIELQLLLEGMGLFTRQPLFFTNSQVDWAATHVYYAHREMELATELDHITARPHKSRFTCPGCLYREPCLALDCGADWKFLLARNFLKETHDRG